MTAEAATLQIYPVSELTAYVRAVLEEDATLQDIWVQGEVSNFSQSVAGHVYFTLKDEASQLRCVLFRSALAWQTFLPRNGELIVAHGRISVYEVQGIYQLYTDLLQPLGVGLLHLQFEALKARLAQEGLFAESRKRPIPSFPRAVAVVTSPVGAALQDILHVLGRRYPLTEVVICPTQVQGEGAAESIAAAIAQANDSVPADVLILARGGGSIEELWPFNEEVVARSVFASRIPVITGIGHETDTTIADLVADLRAPTPSAAAELATPDWRECLRQVEEARRRLVGSVSDEVRQWRDSLQAIQETLERNSPTKLIQVRQTEVVALAAAGQRTLQQRLALGKVTLEGLQQRLFSLNPQSVLTRGYSICWHRPTQRTVHSVAQVNVGDPIAVQVADGSFPSVVTEG